MFGSANMIEVVGRRCERSCIHPFASESLKSRHRSVRFHDESGSADEHTGVSGAGGCEGSPVSRKAPSGFPGHRSIALGDGVVRVVATFVPAVVIQAGGHGWIVWAIGTLVILLIAVPVCYLSRHLTTTSGLYGFAAAALGPVGALLCGWLMVALLGIANVSAVLNFGPISATSSRSWGCRTTAWSSSPRRWSCSPLVGTCPTWVHRSLPGSCS